MNPLLARLHPYPFERWRELTLGVQYRGELSPISLGIGEPRHATPPLIEQAINASLKGLSVYPPTIGEPKLREACAAWLARRYGVRVDPATQLLPVNGSREALFALAQVVLDPTRDSAAVVCPNPFYQIYEGAALLAGAGAEFLNADASTDLGVSLYYTNRPDEALEQFEHSLKVSPQHTKTLLNKGIVLAFGKRDLKAAAAEWEKVVTLAPNSPEGQAARRALEGIASAHAGGGATTNQ